MEKATDGMCCGERPQARKSTGLAVWAKAAAIASIALMCGCGSLDPGIGFRPLTKEQMAYADTLLATRQSATYSVPAFPVVYVKTFGRFQDGYAFARTFYVFPFWGSARLMLFDAEGTPMADTGVRQMGIPIVISYARERDLAASKLLRWRVNVLSVPILGSFVGFGTGYFKLLFAEFAWR